MSGPEGARVLHILTGCTAVGKTQWALRWAEENGAEIISCDSLLFYRGMDIGTAKPTRDELARVRHHLVDIRPVSEPMSAAVYARMARDAADDILARGRRVLVAGGSGFYLRSFIGPVSSGPEVPAAVRSQVADLFGRGGLQALMGELQRLNPSGTGALDTANPRRVVAALERCLASGRTLEDLASEFARAPSAFEGWEVRLARLDREPGDLDARIGARARAMVGAGLVGEVERLVGEGLPSNPSALRAIGYRESLDAIAGRLPLQGLAKAIARSTRALVKKQRTWFRTQLPAHRVVAAGAKVEPSRLFEGGSSGPAPRAPGPDTIAG
ncbi:MAG TPA: tRNA (adenosine(37)-N6)-dimethylallyltransferase MiaA [Opitutaceae bacterium]